MRDLLFDLKIMNSLKTMYDQFSEFSSALPTISQTLESTFLARKTSVIAKIDLAIASNPAIKLDLEALKSGLNAGNDLTVITLPLDSLLDIEGKIKLNQTTYFDLIGKSEFKFKVRTANNEVVFDLYAYGSSDKDINGAYIKSPFTVSRNTANAYSFDVKEQSYGLRRVVSARSQFGSNFGPGANNILLSFDGFSSSSSPYASHTLDGGQETPIWPGLIIESTASYPMKLKDRYTAKLSLYDSSNNVTATYDYLYDIDDYFGDFSNGTNFRTLKSESNIPEGFVFISEIESFAIVSADPDTAKALHDASEYRRIEINYESFTYVTTIDANTPANLFTTKSLESSGGGYYWNDAESEYPIVLRTKPYEIVDDTIDYVKGSAIYLEPSRTVFKPAFTEYLSSVGYIANDAPLYVDTVVGKDGYWADEVYLNNNQLAILNGVWEITGLNYNILGRYPVKYPGIGTLTTSSTSGITFVLNDDGNLQLYGSRVTSSSSGMIVDTKYGTGTYGVNDFQIVVDNETSYNVGFVNNVNANSSLASIDSLIIVHDLTANIEAGFDGTKMTKIDKWDASTNPDSTLVTGSDLKIILLSDGDAIDLALPVNRSFRTSNTGILVM